MANIQRPGASPWTWVRHATHGVEGPLRADTRWTQAHKVKNYYAKAELTFFTAGILTCLTVLTNINWCIAVLQ